jgi:hypothetical protein
LNGIQEVDGSIPFGSTSNNSNKNNNLERLTRRTSSGRTRAGTTGGRLRRVLLVGHLRCLVIDPLSLRLDLGVLLLHLA